MWSRGADSTLHSPLAFISTPCGPKGIRWLESRHNKTFCQKTCPELWSWCLPSISTHLSPHSPHSPSYYTESTCCPIVLPLEVSLLICNKALAWVPAIVTIAAPVSQSTAGTGRAMLSSTSYRFYIHHHRGPCHPLTPVTPSSQQRSRWADWFRELLSSI